MHTEQRFDAVVIGVGASGALTAAQFAREAPAGARLALIGDIDRPARGVAYETPFKTNLLNVPAGRMSAFPDDPAHFLRWLAARLPEACADTFAPRQLYGDYLEDVLELSVQSGSIVPVAGRAIELTNTAGGWRVELADGSQLHANSVVLALGNLLVPGDALDASRIAPFYYRNPWASEAIDGLAPEAAVLLIGTGLTMVDVALSLRERGHRGPIQAVSRHGKLYQFHKAFTPRPLAELPAGFQAPHSSLRWIRDEISRAEAAGLDWRSVIDSLRPHTAAIWQGWNLAQRASFLRHARNLWDLHRHRMAPEVAAQLRELIDQGILRIHVGRILNAEPAPDGVNVHVHASSAISAETITFHVQRVINCTGPGRDITKSDAPLVISMLTKGWLKPDPLRLGIETDPEGRLIDQTGNAIPGLFTIGPLRIAGLWESIAIPEIRNQALQLARQLVSLRQAVQYFPPRFDPYGLDKLLNQADNNDCQSRI